MKRILFTTLSSFLIGASVYAQSEVDLLRLSNNDLTGTARSVAMGGAFGALGGDISGIAINPAGIGVYQSSEVAATFSLRNYTTKTSFNAESIDKSRFRFDLDNFGFVGAVRTYNDDVPFVNFGISYNKLKSFDRKYNAVSKNLNSSLIDFMYQRTLDSYNEVNGSWDNLDVDWMGKLGYEGYLINKGSDGNYYSILDDNETVDNDLYVREKGYINSYDFNVGTTFSDIVSVGLTVAVTDIDYRMSSSYIENFGQGGDMELVNSLKTEATGWQVRAGLIFKPIEELRIGVSYHSPTWYDATDHKWGDLYSSEKPENNGWVETPSVREDYNFRTPDKWVFSIAGIIDRKAIISLDYQLTNYKNGMRFRDYDSGSAFDYQNSYIKQDFRNASSVRVGAEVFFTPRVAGRVGYSWVQSPYNNNLKNNETIELSYRNTIPHYVVEGDAHYVTYGLGYKFTPNFYADLGFVMKFQNNSLYDFPKYYYADQGTGQVVQAVDNHKFTLKDQMFSGVITVGYKFK